MCTALLLLFSALLVSVAADAPGFRPFITSHSWSFLANSEVTLSVFASLKISTVSSLDFIFSNFNRSFSSNFSFFSIFCLSFSFCFSYLLCDLKENNLAWNILGCSFLFQLRHLFSFSLPVSFSGFTSCFRFARFSRFQSAASVDQWTASLLCPLRLYSLPFLSKHTR